MSLPSPRTWWPRGRRCPVMFRPGTSGCGSVPPAGSRSGCMPTTRPTRSPRRTCCRAGSGGPIAAAGTRRPSSHAATYQTLISLMAITGMRLCEAVRMDDTDLDGEGLVLTLHGKNHKDRQIPLDASAVEALRAYARVRDAAHPARTSTAFFASTRGKRMAADQTRAMFARLVTKAGLAAGPSGRRPTLVSLRHTFAVTTMAAMLDGGASPDASFPALSMWMGHKKPMSATRTAAPVE